MWTSPGRLPLDSHAAPAAAKLRARAVGEPGWLAHSGDDGDLRQDDGDRRAHAPHLRQAPREPDPEPEPESCTETALRDAFAALPRFGPAGAVLRPDSEEEEDDDDATGLLAACARRLALGPVAAGAAAAVPGP